MTDPTLPSPGPAATRDEAADRDETEPGRAAGVPAPGPGVSWASPGQPGPAAPPWPGPPPPWGTPPWETAPLATRSQASSGPVPARVGFSTAALVLGVCGVLGLFSPAFWIAAALGVTGVVLGTLALSDGRRSPGSKVTAWAGTVLSAVAVVLTMVVGVVAVALRAVDGPSPPVAAPTAPPVADAPSASPTEEPTAESFPSEDETAPPPPDLSHESDGVPSDGPTRPPPSKERSALGEHIEWDNGMVAAVGHVRRTTFARSATIPGAGVTMTVSLRNGSSDPADLFPDVAVWFGSARAPAYQVYGHGCATSADFGQLAPGRSLTRTLCFSGRSRTIEVSVAPSDEYEAVLWRGRVG